MNDIERYNFWHLELDEFVKKEKLKEVAKKLEGKELFPKKTEVATAFFTNLNTNNKL